MYVYFYDTVIGTLGIEEKDNKIINIYFGKTKTNSKLLETILIKETKKQLDEYFEGKRKIFEIPITLNGTDFQKNVWNNLMKIPYGQVITYKELAKMSGNEKACRAVGNANNKNKIPIIIPCHRVIGSNNKLVGYAGGLDIKQKLLEIEK